MKHIKKITAKDISKRSDDKAREALAKDGKKARQTCPEIH